MMHSVGDAIEETVIAGRADFGITDRHPQGAVDVVKLADQEIVLASPRSLSLPDPFPRALLDELPLIVPTTRSPRHVDFEEFLAGLGVAPPVALETDERSAWANAVSSGIGSALTLASAAAQFERTGVRLRSFEPPMHSTLYLIRRHGGLSHADETFLRLVVELLG